MTPAQTPVSISPCAELPLSFFFLVVQIPVIQARFPGGWPAFAEQHGPFTESNPIAARCAMSRADLLPAIEALDRLDLGEDGFCQGIWDGLFIGSTPVEEIFMLAPWLRARTLGPRIWVSASGTARPDTLSNH